MTRSPTPILALATFAFAALALAQDPPAAPEPKPPLELAAPAAPSKQYGENDLSTLDGDTLRANAEGEAEEGKLEEAIQLQHWSILARQEGGTGQYNLACFYARAGKTDAAFYWLQRSAKNEGADAAWAEQDPDFDSLRRDPRWAKVADHLREWSAWWAKNGRPITLLVLPAGYAKGTAIPALVGLHGLGAHPKDFADPAEFQALADRLGVAFVGVSGTLPLGPASFSWAEDVTRDRQRVDRALTEVADRVTIAPGQVVLVGFSQGAQAAAELAARDPATFAGAIIMSPGGRRPPHLAEVNRTPAHARSGFVIRVNAEEDPSTVASADSVRRVLAGLGCRVEHKSYFDVEDHALPPDFAESLGTWVTFVLGDRRPPPPTPPTSPTSPPTTPPTPPTSPTSPR